MVIQGQFKQQTFVKSGPVGPLGSDGSWVDGETRWAQIFPFGAVAKARYQGIDSTWSYTLKFHGVIEYSLKDRFIWVDGGDRILIPKEPREDPDESQRYTLVIVEDTGEVADD